jgi:hypothetical protein
VQPVCIRNLMLALDALSLPNLTGINMIYCCKYLYFHVLMLIKMKSREEFKYFRFALDISLFLRG